jgi:hypothetical protein
VLRCDILQQQQLGPATPPQPAEQPRRKHAAAVDDQEITGPQQLRQIAHAPVRQHVRFAIEHQQARRVALGERLLAIDSGFSS